MAKVTRDGGADKSDTRLRAAQWMAAREITIFIVEPNGKRPLGGNSWYLRQSTEPKQIAEWFAMTENCNYGCHMGPEKVVIDLDIKPGIDGIAEFDAICKANGVKDFRVTFKTLMVKTPRGGYHLYFKVPFAIANKNTFPAGIDVRGAIGYVVGPGSETDTGKWEVVDPHMGMMDIPEFLLDYMKIPGAKDPQHHVPLVELDLPENIEQARLWLTTAKPAFEGDEGDNHTYEICCKLRDFGLSEGEALNVLNESHWNERCEPPWQNDELEKKIENSYTYGQNRPGCASESLQLSRIIAAQEGRPEITDADIERMFHPPTTLELVVKGTSPVVDDDIPVDVADDAPLTEYETEEQRWHGIEEFAALTTVREYIIQDWLLAHGVTALLARRGTGKSTIALDLGCHLMNDLDWQRIPSLKNWCVIYLCLEDDEGMILNVRAWQEYHKDKHRDSDGNPIEVKLCNDRFRVGTGVLKLTDETKLAVWLKEMLTWADGRRCLIILDTWQRATSGSKSNADDEMEKAVERAEFVAKALRGPMIGCFHPPKDGRMTIRGSAVQEDTTSGLWIMEKQTEGRTVLWIERAKGAGERNWQQFKIHKVELEGVDAHGKPLQGIVPIQLASGTDYQPGDGKAKVDAGHPYAIEAIRLIAAARGKDDIPASEFYEKISQQCHSTPSSEGGKKADKEKVRQWLTRRGGKKLLEPFTHQPGGARTGLFFGDHADEKAE